MKDAPQDFLSRLATALGMKDGAEVSEDQIVADIETMKMQSATNAMNTEIDHDQWVPRSDFELATARINDFEEAEAQRHDDEIVATVDRVIEMGDPSFPPVKREEYLAICRMEGGLERFRSIASPDLSRSLARVATSGLTTPAHFQDSANSDEAKILSHIGLTPKDIE